MDEKRKYVLVKEHGFLLLAAAAVLIYFMLTAFTPIETEADKSNIGEYFVIVKSGDTIWKIAKENNPKQKNVRSWVDEIMEYNNMSDSNVYPGEKIILPV